MVVDLPVVHNDEPIRTRVHWLTATDARIDDRETPMREPDSDRVVEPDPIIVGAPMRERVPHLA